jgi:uncharacterized protein (DUF433 family)
LILQVRALLFGDGLSATHHHRPAIRSGKPCIRGTRIAVGDVIEYLAGGMSIQEVLEDFPYLTAEDVKALPVLRRERMNQIPAGTHLIHPGSAETFRRNDRK